MQHSNKNQNSNKNKIPPLDQIYFYLTEGCNMACRHCWLSPKFDTDGSLYASLPVELFKNAIQEAKPLGLRRVKLTGGEPLLHPEFSKLLAIIRQNELALTIETNGLLCTKKIASEIAKIPNRTVSVSIDGADAATHEWIRGVTGSFERAKRAVKNLAETGTPPQVIMTLMQCNFREVAAIVHMAGELGASSVKFNILQPTGRAEQHLHETNGLSIIDIIETGRYVEMELAKKTPLNLIFDYPLAFRPLSRIGNGDGCSICGILNIIGVISSGQYALCGIGEQVAGLVFGKVGVDELDRIWHSNDILNALRQGIPTRLDGICARCLMKHRCLGACVAQSFYRTGSLWAPFWFCEQAEAKRLFPATRLATE
jgi:SynChlorMet cassette radical SAM/SPASM protein ScmF